ncbi:MAG TPA: glycosyltransferase [Patescibacteria group bacterium]
MTNPKIALVHDYIKEYGGAERVLEALHQMYPDAPVFTLLYAPEFLGPHKERFANWDIRPSFLQSIPLSFKFISIFRLIAPWIFQNFDFSGYDLIIVSATGAYQPNIINKNGAKQICYCHTPPRYLYGYATAREQSNNPVVKALVAIMSHILRMVDFVSSKHVDVFIANSQNIAQRIKKFYRKDAIVVYPPVAVPSKLETIKKENYFLAGGRLARPKHVDLLIKACTTLGVSLKVFGKSFAGYGEQLQKIAGPTIEFLGEVTDAEKITLMKHAKAFLFAAEDEDFGIVPVEAQAFGTPVIAYNSGGVKETVQDRKTGILFNELSEEAIISAIKEFERIKISSKDCFINAQKFSKQNFEKNIKKVVESL